MKANSYQVGQTYTNEKNNKQMTVTGKHRAGEQRGAKTIWHVVITDGGGNTTELEKDSEQLKRIFWEEKKAYTGSASGRVTLTKEGIEKKALGEWQKLEGAMKVCNDFGISVWHDKDDFMKARIEYWTKEALRIEAERKAKAEATAEERKAKKESLDILKELTTEQLKAIIASLNK